MHAFLNHFLTAAVKEGDCMLSRHLQQPLAGYIETATVESEFNQIIARLFVGEMHEFLHEPSLITLFKVKFPPSYWIYYHISIKVYFA